MSNYSDNPRSVRVDFFKECSEKWYAAKDESKFRLKGMKAVCLEPYHRDSYPIICHTTEVLSLVARSTCYGVERNRLALKLI